MTAIAVARDPPAYYADKLGQLRDIFGSPDVRLEGSDLVVRGRRYPIVDDVIVLLPSDRWPEALGARLRVPATKTRAIQGPFAHDIQATFGAEWTDFSHILPEHRQEFNRYFDLVDLRTLEGKRVCDLGCGSGRWSVFLRPHCRELVLVDFSEAIFVARENLRGSGALFFLGDLQDLPFRDDFADFLFCLGVLHHLPTPALDEVRKLRRLAPQILVYLYYALDNRPLHFRLLLPPVNLGRKLASRVRNGTFRNAFSFAIAVLVYKPLVVAGTLLSPLGLGRFVPLYEGYRHASIKRIQQDVYDRFFTRIEQRVTKKDIEGLRGTYSQVTVSEGLPYWHFLLLR